MPENFPGFEPKASPKETLRANHSTVAGVYRIGLPVRVPVRTGTIRNDELGVTYRHTLDTR